MDNHGNGKGLLLILVPLLFSCSPKIVERVVTEVRDTTIVKIHERVVHDTVRIEIPVIIEKNVTPDDSSHLENKYIMSDAWVKDGLLHHTVQTKPQTIEVPVDVQVTDTTTIHEHYENNASTGVETVEVEKPLSWWQKFRIGAFWWLLGGLLIALVWIFRKPLLKLIKMI